MSASAYSQRYEHVWRGGTFRDDAVMSVQVDGSSCRPRRRAATFDSLPLCDTNDAQGGDRTYPGPGLGLVLQFR
ncbi:Uncharacterised protein [Mycobacteroides abscessus subsp. bolletii]|nr:Uncharacterised protein [Mycobacteroides abscessus subsp. bolletii]